MDVFLPIAQVFVNPIEILLLSALVGVLSGLFGVGGGFLMTPFLIFLGVPPAYAVANEANNILAEEQNGFRAGRSCIDHIFVMCTILRNRNLLGKDTFLCFIDYKKAFDSVDHQFTFDILEQVGIPYEFIRWAKLAFTNTSACVLVNGKRSPFFQLPGGGRQGDNLYPLIF